MSASRCLFVAVETGDAAYLRPLWQAYMAEGREDWRVIAGTFAKAYIHAGQLTGLPLLANAPTSEDALVAELDGWRPDIIVMSATSAPLEQFVLNYARLHGIKVCQFVITWYNYLHRFRHEHGLLFPDLVMVIDERAAVEARDEGVPGEIIEIVGHPDWESRELLPASPLTSLAYMDQPVRRHYGYRLGYTQYDAWALISDAAARHPALFKEILYCPHPTQRPDEIPAARDQFKFAGSDEALRRCGTVTGMFSSILTDALLGGRQVVSLQPDARGKDMCGLSSQDLVRRVGTLEEFIAVLTAPSMHDAEDLRQRLKGSRSRIDDIITGQAL